MFSKEVKSSESDEIKKGVTNKKRQRGRELKRWSIN